MYLNAEIYLSIANSIAMDGAWLGDFVAADVQEAHFNLCTTRLLEERLSTVGEVSLLHVGCYGVVGGG